jgi:RNA polymerase sigma factor (sigma-70 family)
MPDCDRKPPTSNLHSADVLFETNKHRAITIGRKYDASHPGLLLAGEFETVALESLWLAARRFKPRGTLYFWIFARRCIIGAILEAIRGQSHPRRRAPMYALDEAPHPLNESGPAELAERAENFSLLLAAVPADRRQIIIWRVLENKKTKFIAQKLGRSERWVDYTIRDALDAARRALLENGITADSLLEE